MIDQKEKINYLLSRIFYIFLCFYFIINIIIKFIYRTGGLLDLWTVCMVLSGIGGVVLILLNNEVKIFCVLMLGLICWATCFLLKEGWKYSFIDFISTVSMMGMAYLLVIGQEKDTIYKILFYITSLIIIYRFIILKIPIRQMMLDGTSYNYIGIALLFYLIIYLLIKEKNSDSPRYVEILLYGFVAVLSYGRGTILSSIILLIFVMMFKMIERKNFRKFILIFGGLVLLMIVYLTRIGQRILNSKLFLKFQLKGFDTGRTNIWETYLHTCKRDILSFIVGGDPTVLRVDANLHNSFLQMNASLGIIFSTVMIILIIYSTIYYVKNKRYWIICAGMIYFIRALSDKMMFSSYGEIILYYYIFEVLINDKTKYGIKENTYEIKKYHMGIV